MVVRVLIVAISLACCGLLQAMETGAGKVQRVATRAGVSVPIHAYWREDALATVVLFSGASGGYGSIGGDGWPTGSNFLISTGKRWASHPFNVVMVGRPSDGIDLGHGDVRAGELHASDNVAVFKALKQISPLPIWLVGTSMGTISVAAATIHDGKNDEGLVAGVVMTSSITADRIPGAVPQQDLERIRVPTLIVHHEDDACGVCRPQEAKHIAAALRSTPIKKTLLVSGGSGATGNPCKPMHHHGFIGIQNEVVDRIAAWIIAPTAD